MASRVVLHIGPRKTATTYLQRALQSLVLEGRMDESIYPMRTRDRVDHNQVPGLIDLAREADAIGLQGDAWQQQDGSDARELLRVVGEAPGEVILSAEALSVITAQGAEAVVAAFAPAPVQVIITARDLGRVLPSSWQQHMRNGNFEAYADYLRLRREERESGSYRDSLRRAFWRAYRYADLATRWQGAGATSVAVVTVPPAGAATDLVWQRFVAAAGVSALPIEAPQVPADRANISLTGAESYALQGFNVAARAAGQGRRDVRATHRTLLRRGWVDRPDRGHALGLPDEVAPLVAAWAEQDINDLRGAPLHLHGDLDDLLVTHTSGTIPTAEEVAVAAGAAMHLLTVRRTSAETE